MKKSIKVKIVGHPDELITKAKHAAEKHGLRFTGDTEKGLIKGLGIEANYFLQEDVLTIKILHKPLLLSWAKLEQKVRTLVNINQNIG
jgi:phosphoenolpyruvate synthase/pyruvate phosphate dikinase